MFSKKDKLSLHAAGTVVGVSLLLWSLVTVSVLLVTMPVFLFEAITSVKMAILMLYLLMVVLDLICIFIGIAMTNYCLINGYRLLRELSDQS